MLPAPAPRSTGAAAPARRSVARVIELVLAAAGLFAFAWIFRFNNPSGSFAGLTDDQRQAALAAAQRWPAG